MRARRLICVAYAKAEDGKNTRRPEFRSDNSTIACEVTSGDGRTAG